ncbi:MAG: hypothetical protein IKF72_06170 [Kiritimatiellae bacterium]|nr:hypothetical protein [Kiritimatiellia bacterium]
MKLWKLIVLTVALVGLGIGGWWLSAPKADEPDDKPGRVLRSRVIREEKPASRASARRIAAKQRREKGLGTLGSDTKKKAKVDEDWNPFDDEKGDFDMDIDFTLEGEVAVEMSKAVRDILTEMRRAQMNFDRKGVLAAVRKLLAKISRGSPVSSYAKCQAVEAIKSVGGGIMESLPELAQLAADESPEVAEVSLEAIQELLWDFDTTPQQISEAIGLLVKMTTDGQVLNPFIFEMNGMPNSIKVETALVILDSGNQTAIDALGDNMAFVFDDFAGKIQTREDIIQYGKENPDVIEE